MNKINLFFVFILLVIGLSCSKENSGKEVNILSGMWIEKNPELYDGIPDTIVFTSGLLIEKYFYFQGFSYERKNDSLIFFNSNTRKSFFVEYSNLNEIVIHNFIDRSITAQVKNIPFVKKK